MPAERAGYTVTMFIVDISPSMGTMRTVDLPPGPDGEERTTEMTNLEWSLQFVKLKIQEMIFNGRKTDQCGVIIFGSEETSNIINENHGGYDHVSEYIPIGQPNAGTLSKIDALKPSEILGDPVDALIVGIETQAKYLASKKTWTRKIVLVTDGENPIEYEDWEATVQKINMSSIGLTIIGVDFDDEELPFKEENKSEQKRSNEEFYHTFVSGLQIGIIGSCALALRETARPDIKQTKSTLMGTVLRLGDVDSRSDEAIEIIVKTSKCTALTRPKGWKKFAIRESLEDDDEMEGEDEQKTAFAQLKMRSEYFVDRGEHDEDDDGDVKMEEDNDTFDEAETKAKREEKEEQLEKVEKEQLIRGFKYGTTYVPCPDGQFPRLPTKRGIDLCGFFPAKNFRRELSIGELQYVWADPSSPSQQVALSSIVQAMYEKGVMAIARWVTKDEMDPKMGVLSPVIFDEVDCLLWAQMPFADDVRKYTFASLDNLISRKGEAITEHPYIPTQQQLDAMDNLVDAMDLMEAGDKDEEGNRGPWYDTLMSYNPAVHRTKQALFHCAIVSDISANPLPPPHPELVKYFEPPRRVLKRAREAIEECKEVFKIRQVPKKIARSRKDGHAHAADDDDDLLLLDRKQPASPERAKVHLTQASPTSPSKRGVPATNPDDSETEDEDEDEMLLDKKKPATPPPNPRNNQPLPTPARSLSPQIDPGRAPGRIIGSTYPLADFKKNLAQGDIVTKAVEDLAAVITEIVIRPFASRRSDELLECMKALRETCLEEDEIDAWNNFLPNLRERCMGKMGNVEFWSQVKDIGRPLSLISDKEASKLGGTSDISEEKSKQFIS